MEDQNWQFGFATPPATGFAEPRTHGVRKVASNNFLTVRKLLKEVS
jgi:hypothetical protein